VAYRRARRRAAAPPRTHRLHPAVRPHARQQAHTVCAALRSHRPGGAPPADEAAGTTLLVPAGGAIAFDYQLWHRALRNCSSADRPVLYMVVGKPSVRGGLKGLPSLDCGTTSIFDGSHVLPVPAFRLGSTVPQADPSVKRPRRSPRFMSGV